MNERLIELADKSGFGRAWYDPTIPTSDIDHRWIDQRRLKEFAELIVRECADLCSNPLDTEDILEHFGVPPA